MSIGAAWRGTVSAVAGVVVVTSAQGVGASSSGGYGTKAPFSASPSAVAGAVLLIAYASPTASDAQRGGGGGGGGQGGVG